MKLVSETNLPSANAKLVSDTSFSLLAIDAGNTRIKWGIHRGDAWLAAGSIPTSAAATLADSLGEAFSVDRAIASNVAGDEVQGLLEALGRARGLALSVVHAEREALGVTNGYRDPSQLGPDRWAALIAAHHSGVTGHKLVVNAGTALTIDALTAEGRFLGGLIVPGPALMRSSLDRGTARLRMTEGALADFPASTPDAITSGAIHACAGAVERLGARMAAHGCAPESIILSGGAAGQIAASLPIEPILRETLVLDGLALIARRT